ncbi:MAG: zinc ribbon domain-containing protein [Anaerolineae bacterium]
MCAGCNTVINLPEAAYCYKCGVPLTPSLGLSPAHCPACQVALPVDAAFCHRCGTAIPPAGVDVASPATSPYLLLVESNVKLDFPNGTISLVVGREDPVSDIFPEINLEPHDGEYGGVSRRHAVFSWRNGQWHVEDLDSTNFTFVNKQKLPPHQFTPVKNGDEIRFGKIATVFTQ